MLSHKILTRQDVGRAASYYEDAADDYYAKEGEASAWQGKGAETLGLSGPVQPRHLRELLTGHVELRQPRPCGFRRSSTDATQAQISEISRNHSPVWGCIE